MQYLDTNDIATRDRVEFVQEAVTAGVVPCEIDWLDDHQGVQVRGFITDMADLTLCSGGTTARTVRRTPKLARDSMEPSVLIHIQHTGTNVVTQQGRESVVRPGDLVISDSTSPCSVHSGSGTYADIFRIPHSALALPHDMIRDACAATLSPGHPITSLADGFLRRVSADPTLFTAANADLVARPSIELIRAVIITHLRADGLVPETMAVTLQVRIMEYTRQHLHDPDLNIEQIAAAHFISVRYLYKVLSKSGIGLADWIRTRRLEACRKSLTDAPRTTTIAAIARRNGFSDMSSFSRSFRTEYGMTPRQWRDRGQVN